MRNSSGDRKVRPSGFRSEPSNSVRKDSNRTPSRGVRRDSGMGWDGKGGDLPKLEERRAWEYEFVRKNLPEQHEGLALSALLSLRQAGEKISREAVLNRLRNSGRSAEQLRERGWV